MGVLSQLMRRQPATQSLAKAPSLDLIKGDDELVVPIPKEIELHMESEKLIDYARTVNAWGFASKAVQREKLLHHLKSLDLRIYDPSLVYNFMKQNIKHSFETLKLDKDLWWKWEILKEYAHPVPFRVTDIIKNIYQFDQNIVFFISDIFLVTRSYNPCGSDNGHENTDRHINESRTIFPKFKTEICFLRVGLSEDTPIEETLIIDAWRGPTFSDEEARLPGQTEN